MIYISLPYTDPDQTVVNERFKASCLYSAKLLREGHIIQSPISTGHAIAEVADLPTDFQFWRNYCLSTLWVCKEMHVLMLDGWQQSTGVKAEIDYAIDNQIAIKYVDPHTFVEYDSPVV
jgi:hypothetical protein